MTAGILQVHHVETLWPVLEPMLARAVAHSTGEVATADVLEAVRDKRMFIAVAMNEDTGQPDLVAACEVVVYPRLRALHVVLMAGRLMAENREHYAVLEQAARQMECVRVQALCQRPAARLFARVGFESLYSLIAKEVSP